jgi:hypothetical protein
MYAVDWDGVWNHMRLSGKLLVKYAQTCVAMQQQSHNAYASPQMPHPVMSAFLQGPNAPQGSLLGQAISGRVEAQFDCGYFVSFSVGGHDYFGAPPLGSGHQTPAPGYLPCSACP